MFLNIVLCIMVFLSGGVFFNELKKIKRLKKGERVLTGVYNGVPKYATKKDSVSRATTAAVIALFCFLCLFAPLFSSNSGTSKKCAICGKTTGLKQITAQTSSGRWDNNWYCDEHYADAWQYYYGNGK